MPLTEKTDPSGKVLDLSELKDHLNLDGVSRFDSFLNLCIDAVEHPFQHELGIQLLEAELQWTWKEFVQKMELPRPPLKSVSKVEYRDDSGSWITVDESDYEVNKDATPGFVRFNNDYEEPETYENEVYPWRFTYTAGFGAQHSDIPSDLRVRMHNAIGTQFMKREDTMISNGSVDVKHLEKVMARYVKAHNARNRWG